MSLRDGDTRCQNFWMNRGNEVVHDGPGQSGDKSDQYLFSFAGLNLTCDFDSCLGEQKPWGTVSTGSLTCSAPVTV